MSLFKIAWRSIQQRGIASALTCFSMALGVLLVVLVLTISGLVNESFRTNSSLGYNLIVGAKGGKLQLVLNTVYYLSSPVENISYSFYEEFLDREERGDGRDGRYAELTRFAIPVCLGDYFQGYRVVGTTPAMFEGYEYDSQRKRKYEFAEGRCFETYNREHGFFEAVVGATVARERGLKVGDTFAPTHGPEGDTHDEFFLVGILKPSGTPVDRAVFVNMEGFYLLKGHAKPVADTEDTGEPGDPTRIPLHVARTMESMGPVTESPLPEARQKLKPLPIPEREVTAILLRTANSLMTLGLRNEINEGGVAQAVPPIQEISLLFETFVKPIQAAFLLFTALICLISGVSILVSIYNSMSDRRHEIAVMRALGARRGTVLWIVLLESVLLALGGGLLGWMAGHALIGGPLSSMVEQRTGVEIGVFDFAPAINPVELLGGSSIVPWSISPEFLLIPLLILLAIVVGVVPALAAYRTDVAKSLSASP